MSESTSNDMTANEWNTSPYYVGMKVEVDIPMPDKNIFRDWAIINEVDQDLVSLQLSRDILPFGVNLRVGQMLTIRNETDFKVFIRRAYIVSKSLNQDLLLRFTGEILFDKLREFFRIDAFLPIRFHKLHDQNPVNVRQLWEDRKRQRQENEFKKEASLSESADEKPFSEEQTREPTPDTDAVSHQDDEKNDEYYDSWDNITSIAVNISGGGLKISTDQKFESDELILLEIFVPPARRVMDVVARVIFSTPDETAEKTTDRFNTGLQFIFIDELTRSSISNHISNLQLQRIRSFKGFADVELIKPDSEIDLDKHYAYLDTLDAGDAAKSPERGIKKKLVQIALAALLVFVIGIICSYFSHYVITRPKNAIQNMFETGIRKLRGY